MDTYFTPEELARQFKLNRVTIYRLLKQKKIPAIRIGKSYRISSAALDQWMAGQKKPAPIPAVVREYIALLRESSVKNKIIKVILFGSCARGDQNENSDIDLLIITKNTDESDEHILLDLLTDAELKCEDGISLMTKSTDAWNWMKKNNSGFYRSIMKEGKELWKK